MLRSGQWSGWELAHHRADCWMAEKFNEIASILMRLNRSVAT